MLGHKVDRFGLSTLKEKTDAIASLDFPVTLAQLDHFIGLTGYYRSYVARYASISEPLHLLKTRLLKGSPRKSPQRQVYTRNTKIVNPSKLEIASFQTLKNIMCSELFLVHDDSSLPLLYYVDSSQEGMACAVHQVPKHIMAEHSLTLENIMNGNYPRDLERPVMYLSRLLSKYEVNYWPTELEIAGIVWSMQKMRHMIEGSVAVKIYTDHKSAEDVLNSRTLSKTTSTVRMNLRLIRASQFVSQFPMVKVIYKPGKDNVNADALSRLITLRNSELAAAPNGDDEGVYGFAAGVTTVGLSPETLRRLTDGYQNDRHFSLIYDNVKKLMDNRDKALAADIPASRVRASDVLRNLDRNAPDEIKYGGFVGRLIHGHLLLYLQSPKDKSLRLCIPRSCHLDFLHGCHDKAEHAGFDRAYARLRQSYYFFKMSQVLREYIASCPSCQRNRPTNHKPYGKLQPIEIPIIPFEFVTMDFIVKLPTAKFQGVEYDSILTITCKLCKVVTLLLGREDWTAQEWADTFVHGYYKTWGVPSRIISDRGKVFMSAFWTSLFRILRTRLLLTTSYHPQTDGQSEHTNQTVEMALRHLVAPHHRDWPIYVAEVQFMINTSHNVTLGCSPMQFLTGLDFHHEIDLATRYPGVEFDLNAENFAKERHRYQCEAMDSIIFAQSKMSHYYDSNHKPISFRTGDKVYITMAHGSNPGYRLPGGNAKLSNRRVGPFCVIEPVGDLAYRLQLPEQWHIHPVISVAHLEKHNDDPYSREAPPPPDIVVDESEDAHEEYEVEGIVATRYNKRKKRQEWLVKWKNWGTEHNSWLPRSALANTQELLEEFEAAQTQVISTVILPTLPSPPRNPGYSSNIL